MTTFKFFYKPPIKNLQVFDGRTEYRNKNFINDILSGIDEMSFALWLREEQELSVNAFY